MTQEEDPRRGYDDRRYGERPRSRFQEDMSQLFDRAYDYVRSRTAEHWILFLSGLALGLLLG